MHPRTREFASLVKSYSSSHERQAAAVEFAELYIEQENAAELLSVLKELSPEAEETFMGRVSRAPSSEAGWEQFIIIGANQSKADAARAKARWRECVHLIRTASASFGRGA